MEREYITTIDMERGLITIRHVETGIKVTFRDDGKKDTRVRWMNIIKKEVELCTVENLKNFIITSGLILSRVFLKYLLQRLL